MMDVKYLMEKLGQAKTHLEMKKMIAEVDTTNSGAINYRDFVRMMLGPHSGVLKMYVVSSCMMNPPLYNINSFQRPHHIEKYIKM